MEPLSKKVKAPDPDNTKRYEAIDFALSGVQQFPSTPKKAQEVWTNFLNEHATKGLKFVTTFKYALGADHSRRMVIFENENTTK